MTHVDEIIEEAELNLRKSDIQVDPTSLFGNSAQILKVGIPHIMEQAVPVLKNGHADNRADAIEMAFDFMLAKLTKDRFRRVGEVRLNRPENVAEALCHRRSRKFRRVPITK